MKKRKKNIKDNKKKVIDYRIRILFNASCIFTGYMIGRLGHFILGSVWFLPHHWIIGLIIIIIPLIFHKNKYMSGYGEYMVSFGLGLFISDLNDFLHIRTFEMNGSDLHPTRFWNIDKIKFFD